MVAQISIHEFRARLKANTKIGNPEISGSPLHAFNMVGEKEKLFYGTFRENDFNITPNAILFPIPYILKGKIKSKNLNQTEILYEIVPIRFGYYWIRYFPFIAFILFNIIFIIEKSPLVVWVFFNLFIFLIGLISNLRMNYKKNYFERKFIKLFEISDKKTEL